MTCAVYDPDCYGCRLRAKSLRFTAAATPVMRAHRPFRPKVNCSWEAGIITDPRPDGTRVPVLGPDLQPIRVKEYSERRREIDAGLKANKTPARR